MRGLLGKGVNAECRLRSWEPFENTERPHRPGSQKRQPCRCGLSAPVPQEGTAGRFAKSLANRSDPNLPRAKNRSKIEIFSRFHGSVVHPGVLGVGFEVTQLTFFNLHERSLG